jgi:hypothetical protein
MSEPYVRFAERMDRATDHVQRRTLLAEIGMWRAGHLTDIPALRDAAYAMASLHAALGEHDSAVREARALLSLCSTPPMAGGEEKAHARALLSALGTKVAPNSRREKRERAQKSKGPGGQLGKARDALSEQAWEDALRILGGIGGANSDVLRTYAYLGRAMAIEDANGREAAVRDLMRRLRKHLNIRAPRRPDPTPRPLTDSDRKLAALLGIEELPRGRKARAELIENHLVAHADQADDLAVAALEQHVASEGLKEPAPWLFGVVAVAMSTGPAFRTRRALEALKAQGAYAVSAYDEWPFTRAVEVLAESVRSGHEMVGFRRGVARGEPKDRKLWTLRLRKDGIERMLAVAPYTNEDYRPGTVDKLVTRLMHLSDRVLVLASGHGNKALRDAAQSAGIAAMDDAANAQIVGALEAVAQVAVPDLGPRGSTSPDQGNSERSAPRPKVPKGPDPRDEIAAALHADTPPTVEQLVPLISLLSRVYYAFAPARSLVEGDITEDADARLAVLLEAADQAAPESIRLLEGGTMAMVMASAFPEGPTSKMLDRPRYGGGKLSELIGITREARKAGWRVDRLLRGPTRRERRDQAGLDPLAESMRELYRLFLDGDDVRVELWFIGDLPVEGRAGIPQLLLCGHPKAVVTPEGFEWGFEGPEPLTWTGDATVVIGSL